MFNLCSKFNYSTVFRWWLALVLICCATTFLHAQETTESKSDGDDMFAGTQQTASDKPTIKPILTDSPRATLKSFLRLRDELEQTLRSYRLHKSRELAEKVHVITSQFHELLDLPSVPPSLRDEIGTATTAYLLDILGRVELPNPESVPDEEAFDDGVSPAKWRIPNTPIWIVQADKGAREGEFLFSESTVMVAPRFYQGIKNLPLQTSLSIISWHRAMREITGPMIPAAVLRIVPQSLRDLWLDTPKWKVIAAVLLSALATLLLFLFHRAINRRKTENRVGFLLRRALTPIAILVVVWSLKDFIDNQIFVSGAFSAVVVDLATILINAGAVWLLWLVMLAIFERIIQARGIPEDGFDAQLWRIGARTLGTAVSVVIIGNAAQELGLPLYSVVAGLGIGGLAVALAIRPTLENLIGGIMLYLDQPVRIGDFCSFGDKTGTVETIGVRTTKIRALDRTLISIPNATLADMQLINWAKCDRMLISATIGLRYETGNDQLRQVLVKFREMLHAHPKIDTDTVRVRFAGFGQSSLDIGVRIYALTQDFNEYHAIREDVLLRMSDIVKKSGSSFAFPSQTLYMGRDDGLDVERGKTAAKEVESWRKAGKLPFPRLAADRIEQLKGTLDYPPRGSVEAGTFESQVWETSERLSAERDDEEESDRKPPSQKRGKDS
ncbi:MAG: mechanosensitive ion channel family protein [Desulfobacterales bacterium]